jgi:LacI family transcriptional regulator
MTDLSLGSYLLVKYLLDLGYRDIGFLFSADPTVALSALRLRGYRRAFEERGLIMDETLIRSCTRRNFPLPDTTMSPLPLFRRFP